MREPAELPDDRRQRGGDDRLVERRQQQHEHQARQHQPEAGPLCRGGGHPYAQTRFATPTSVRVTVSVSDRLTHSSTAWAPSPLGPNITVGMPAAAMKAASAQ